MRRVLIFSLVLLALALSLPARSIGYGFGYYGQTNESQPDLTSSGVELSLVYKPWDFAFANPSLIAKSALGTDQSGAFLVPYLQIGLGLDVFRTIHHPFNFLAHNVIAYSPMIHVSYHADLRQEHALLGLEVSPFKLVQKDFWYEVLSPFFIYDIQEGELDSWGFNLIRFTYFLK